MAIKCFFGRHEWAGCKCLHCNTYRDEQHDFNDGCKCIQMYYD